VREASQKRFISVPVDGVMAVDTDAPAVRFVPAGREIPAPFDVMPTGLSGRAATFARRDFAVSLKRRIFASSSMSCSTRFFDGRFTGDGLSFFRTSPGRLGLWPKR